MPSLPCLADLAARIGPPHARWMTHRPRRPRRKHAPRAWPARLIFFLVILAMMLTPILSAAGAPGVYSIMRIR